MNEPTGMTKIIGRKRYSVDASKLIADDVYWDGSNFERGGRNTFLYITENGNYFQVVRTQWQGEDDTLTPLVASDAADLWESLREHYVEFEDAFPDLKVEDA